MDHASIPRIRRGPLMYSLGGLAAIACVTASAYAIYPTASQFDPTVVGVASRIGVDAPLADSLRGVDVQRLTPVEAAALDGVDADRIVWLGRTAVDLHPEVVPFYRSRSLLPVWTDSAARDTLLFALRDSRLDGLDPETYHADELTAIAAALDTRDPLAERPQADTLLADFDLALTSALFRYAHDLSGDRVDPTDLYGHLTMDLRTSPEAPARLAAVLAEAGGQASGVGALVESLRPQHEGYRNLRVAMGAVLDGTAPDTLSADLLRLNLERWRWMPRDLGDRHVFVDVPGYQLWLRERTDTGFADSFEMKVVVGKPGRWETPVMTDTMETIVFSPTWTIPASIQIESYGFVQKGGRVQPPGPRNPMGRAKFLFPNGQAIYIHDTNSKWGFSREYRALSHGCVRAADPRDFATAVLTRTNGWTVEEVAERFEGSWTPETVKLKADLPVHLTYFTAWSDASGTVRTTPDVYNRDAPLAAALGLTL